MPGCSRGRGVLDTAGDRSIRYRLLKGIHLPIQVLHSSLYCRGVTGAMVKRGSVQWAVTQEVKRTG
jgi:hypothetical protein